MKSNTSRVVLVNSRDEVTGYREKFAAHKIPVPLHRAVSVVIFAMGFLTGNETQLFVIFVN